MQRMNTDRECTINIDLNLRNKFYNKLCNIKNCQIQLNESTDASNRLQLAVFAKFCFNDGI